MDLSAIQGFKFKRSTKDQTVYTERSGKKYRLVNEEKVYIEKGLEDSEELQRAPGVRDCRQFFWSEKNNDWVLDPKRKRFTGEQVENEFTLVSWNVWFVEERWEERADALFAILQQIQPHVICLQEVRRQFLKRLLLQPWLRARYAVSDKAGTTLRGSQFEYGVIMCTALTIEQMDLCDFPLTQMNRRLLRAHLRLNESDSIVVCTSHLESMDKSKTRIIQLDNIFGTQIQESDGCALFCGDTNFSDGDPENEHIPQYFKDCYTGELSEGLTCFSRRLDKCYIRSNIWQPTQFQRLGMDPIFEGPDESRKAKKKNLLGELMQKSRVDAGEENEEEVQAADDVNHIVLTPSDHFGIHIKFSKSM